MLKKFLIILGFCFLPVSLVASEMAAPSITPEQQSSLILAQAKNLKPDVLKLALTAYQQVYLQKHTGNRGVLTIIDYSLPSIEKRLWVVNLNKNVVLFHTYVSHGEGSGSIHATHFSNAYDSKATSIGVFLTGYTYYGSHGYSLKLYGLEHGFNDNAFGRGVVMHSSPAVNERMVKRYKKLGTSWGCLELDVAVYKKVFQAIKGGTVLVSYYPDQKWLASSSFVSPALANQHTLAMV